MHKKNSKNKGFVGISFSWDPKSKEDRGQAKDAIAEAIRQGHWYDVGDEKIMSESVNVLAKRKGPPDSYMKKHKQLDMVDVLMEVVDSEDLASIIDYLAHIGACPMLYTVIESPKRGKTTHRKFKFGMGGTLMQSVSATHTNPTQAAINAVLLWDKKGRP